MIFFLFIQFLTFCQVKRRLLYETVENEGDKTFPVAKSDSAQKSGRKKRAKRQKRDEISSSTTKKQRGKKATPSTPKAPKTPKSKVEINVDDDFAKAYQKSPSKKQYLAHLSGELKKKDKKIIEEFEKAVGNLLKEADTARKKREVFAHKAAEMSGELKGLMQLLQSKEEEIKYLRELKK